MILSVIAETIQGKNRPSNEPHVQLGYILFVISFMSNIFEQIIEQFIELFELGVMYLDFQYENIMLDEETLNINI